MDLPFLNTSPSPEGSDGGDDATLNDLLALYQSANDVPPPFAPLAEEAFPAAPAAPVADFATDFAAPAMDFGSDLPFAAPAAPAPLSPDAEIDDLIKSFQDAAPAPVEPAFMAPEPFAAPEPPFAAEVEAPSFLAPEPFEVPEPAFAAPAIPDPFAAPEIPAAPPEPAFMAPEPEFMAPAIPLEEEVALEPVFAPEPEPVFAPEPAFIPEPEPVFAPEPEPVFALEPDVALEPVVEAPVMAAPEPVLAPEPIVPAPVAEAIQTVVPVAAPVAAASVAVTPFTGDLPSIATPAERQAVNRGVLEALSQIATGIDQVQGELNGLYENLAQAASHRASVGEIVTLTERLTAVKGEVGENSALYQQALQLRAVAEAYMQLLKNL